LRSIEVVNHQRRHRLQHKMAPKHHSSPGHPHRRAQSVQSDQSNWHSSLGAVSMGTDAAAAARNLGPRSWRTKRTTVGYEPAKPSRAKMSNRLVDNRRGLMANRSSMRIAQPGVITRCSASSSRCAGGPPDRNHLLIV
jgi:hypothetical protein